ncbi:MAG: hypothetical protein ACT4PL_06200 [Phycisphaerales bacterium]
MKICNFVVSALALAAAAGSASAQGGNSFANAVAYNGPQEVAGAYTAATLSETLVAEFSDRQIRGGMSLTGTHSVMGLTAGASYRARTSQPAGRASMDTLLRSRNSSNAVLASNDDFTGLGFYSQVSGSVPGDGTINFDVTRFGNASFSAAISNDPAQFYTLSVFSQTVTAPGVDVQWYRFTGLGGILAAEVLSSTGITDTYLAAFNSSGTLLGADDDDGIGLLSSILPSDNIEIPADGIIYLAVARFAGTVGAETNPNSYLNNPATTVNGALRLNVVPTPGAVGLAGLAGLMVARRRRA